MPQFFSNIRYAVRQFRRSPIFTAAAVLTLALGIGGTTAIFTLINTIELRSLPVADPGQLYRVGEGRDCCVETGPQRIWGFYSYPLYQRLKAAAPEFEETAAFQAGRGVMSVRGEGETVSQPLRSEYVSGSYFSMLGVGAFGGRMLTPQDDREGAQPVAVISHRAWEVHFGGDPGVLGATYSIEGHPFTVVGVAPPGFFGEMLYPDPPDFWIPLHQEPLIDGKTNLLHQSAGAWLRMMGRLRPGASIAGMSARLTGVLRQWLRYDSGYPANWMPDVMRNLSKQVITVIPGGAGVAMMKEAFERSLEILLAVCGLVLLIACANVANLLLARAASRRSQTAIRLAVGATRAQIVSQALAESVLLVVGGWVAGLLVAFGAARLLLWLAFPGAFLPISAVPSPAVLAIAFVLALGTAIVFGAAPAWFSTRTDPAEALHGASRGSSDRSSFTRKGLLVAQAALSVVLVAGATMLGRSLGNLEHQDFGFRVPARVLVALHNPPADYSQAKLNALYREIEDRLNRLPGVRASGLALYNPLTSNWGELIYIEGHKPPPTNENTDSSWDRVSAGYLQDLGVALVRGRYFTPADNENSDLVAIVNQAFVKRFFKSGEDPMGQHFGLDYPENAGIFRIVGMVRDAKFAGYGLDRPARPMFYVPLAQNVDYRQGFLQQIERRSHFVQGILLVTSTPPGELEPLLTRTLSQMDSNLAVTSVRTLQRQIELSFDRQRAVAGLAGLFGIVALLLAAVGLYGVTAYSVERRTNEIGIRMALGADRAKVVRLVLRGAFVHVLLGLIIGIPLSLAAGRLIAAQLYGVESWDPLALTVAAVALAVCAFFAALIPASRAAAISPVEALRAE